MKRAYVAALPVLLLLASCDSLLEEEVYSELGPSNFFQSEQDAVALLNSAYDIEQNFGTHTDMLLAEVNTDLMIQRQGGQRRWTRYLEDFTWDATHPWMNGRWDRAYRAIYRTNLALERIPEMEFSEARKQMLLAEARFIRAESYMELYSLYGPTPLITSSEVDADAKPTRATEEEMQKFITSEMRAAAGALPTVAAQYPRATKGAALGFLTRFYLNTHQWQQAADAAKEVMDLGIYSLFDAKHRTDLFKIENERNPEFIHVRPFVTNLRGNNFMAQVAPPRYRFQAPPKTNWATQWKLRTAFTTTFHPQDQRKDAILTEYVNTAGKKVKLGKDDWRSFKYQEDLGASGLGNGNDIPVIRYADILLMRAEALNELQGPNAESIDLINQVREKAGVPPVTLAQLSSKQALRDHILKERSWEFFTEGVRRDDLIRHGKFIEMAQQRGKAAQPHHVRFPLPQSEIDKNPNLQQNPGY